MNGNMFDDEQLEQPNGYAAQADEILAEDAQPAPEADVHINAALQRIEQAQLYKTLITHSVFGENSARPEVQAVVEQEIRDFATQRLEILVGIRPEATPAAFSQFSEEEVAFLKALFSRAQQKGAASPQPAATSPTINPVQAPSPTVNKVRAQPQARPTTKPASAPAKKRVTRTKNVGEFSGKELGQVGNPGKALPMPTPAQMIQMTTPNMGGGGGGGNDMMNQLAQAFVQVNSKDPKVQE